MNGWTMIISFMNPQDAYMARAYLEGQEIAVVLQDELTAQVYNFYSQAIGGVKLWVRNEDYSRAVRLLEEGGYIVPEAETEEPWEWVDRTEKATRRCPFCHSDNIGKSRRLSPVAVFIYFLCSLFLPVFRITWKCYDCGKAWKYKNRH